MLGSGKDRIYNLVSIVFLVLTVLWVIFVAIQMASG
jgi:hypothetical protein